MVCLSEYEIWIIGFSDFKIFVFDNSIRFLFDNGEFFWLIKIFYKFVVIVVIKSGDLLYVDDYRNINIVEDN